MATIINHPNLRKLLNKANIDIHEDEACLQPNVYILKRKMERFDLELTAYLSVADKGKKQKSYEFMTGNICAGGAFFKTDKPFRVGTDVKLAIILPLGKFKNVKRTTSHINVSGSVIRTDQRGMAIRFDRKYKILPHQPTDA